MLLLVDDDEPEVIAEVGRDWRAADKVVFSSSLTSASTARTRIEREFDPATIRHLKGTSAADLSVGGAELAGQALAAGLVDELHVLTVPWIVGGGRRALPDGVRLPLRLLGTRRFASGVIHCHYAVDG